MRRLRTIIAVSLIFCFNCMSNAQDKALLKNGDYDTAAAQHLGRAGGLGDYFWIDEARKLHLTRPA